jgi:plastocyanin
MTTADYDATSARNSVSTINEDKDMVEPELVSITASGFVPQEVNVTAGRTVRFTNNDSIAHSIVADDLSWGSGTLQPDESFVRRFSDRGVAGFSDGHDESITGAVVIE